MHLPHSFCLVRRVTPARDAFVMGGAAEEMQSLTAPEPTGAVLDERLLSKLMLRILPTLWAGYVLNIIDRSNLGYAQLQMSHDLELSSSSFGLAAGLFFLAYATMQVPSNHLLQSVGAVRVLAASMVGWGLASTATSLVQSKLQLCALRFCLGLAEAGYYPGALLYMTRWFPDAAAGRAVAWFATAAAAGSLLGNLSSGLILSRLDGAWGVRGWRWLLVLQGIPAVALGCCVPALLDEWPERARWLGPSERDALVRALRGDATPGEAPAAAARVHASPSKQRACVSANDGVVAVQGAGTSLWAAVRACLWRSHTWVFMVQYIGITSITNTVRFFLPSLLKEAFRWMEPWHIGVVCAVPALAKVVGTPLVARAADRARTRRFAIAWGLSAAAAGLVLGCAVVMLSLGLLRMPQGALAGFLLITLLAAADIVAQCAIPTFWSLHHASQRKHLIPCSIALVNSIGNLGGFLGPSVLGAMHDAPYWGGPRCEPAQQRANGGACSAQWGWGTALLGACFGAITLLTARSARRLGVGTHVLAGAS